MILDEIQTGMGRTGEWFAFQHNNIEPDVMTLAKALGNGVPIGACLNNKKASGILKPGNHGSTFGGNPLACAAALAVIEVMQSESLVSKANELGRYMLDGLNRELANTDVVQQIRGSGLMIGIELNQPCAELVGMALEQGLLFSVQSDLVIRLLPPLIINQQQADEIIQGVCQLIISWSKQKAA